MNELIPNLEAWLKDFQITGEVNNEEFITLCPFHEDDSPSLALNLSNQKFFCHACDAKGDAIKFIAAKMNRSRASVYKLIIGHDTKKEIHHDTIIGWNRNLKKSGLWLKKITEKGISKDTIEEYLLGFDGERITIPIFSPTGSIINVRRYLPNAKRYKMLSMADHGEAVLYPSEKLHNETVCIVEGEMKALLLNQLGFHSISPTGGANTWKTHWSKKFTDKIVYIIFDIDKAGKKAALKIARLIFPYAKQIYLVDLPIDEQEIPKGDITNYFVDLQHTAEDFTKLLASVLPWEPPKIDENSSDEKVTKLHLAKTSKGVFSGRMVETKIIVSAKDTAPFLIPSKFEVTCDKDQDFCAICGVFNSNATEIEIQPTNPAILEMINVPKTRIRPALMSAAKIPTPCKKSSFKITEKKNVEEIRVIPELEMETLETQQVVRKAYFVGHGIETNANYKLTAKVVAEPSTQYATLLIKEAEPSVDSLSTFSVSRQLNQDLSIFRPDEWTLESLQKKLTQIYDDFECNVTRIYQRRDLHTLYDLVYHSVLYIPFQEKIVKGWVEGLVIGDSGQGKSETAVCLQKHYQMGDKVDTKGSTVAGLLGGLQETAKRWWITWGVIPLNDRRLVILEEVKGMDTEIIGKLTDMRSSGVAEISKIQHAKTNARTRLIWITNPRSDVPILQYNFGIQAIPQLMGSLEDIRRLDLAIVVASGEVDDYWLNISSKDRPKIPNTFTSELCKNLILWAWSRKPDDIVIPEETEELILEHAAKQGKEYSAQIPLIEAADHRLKLARLSAAVAARTYSSYKGKLVVRPCHVEFVVSFLNRIYGTKSNGYKLFSSMQIEHTNSQYDKKEIENQFSQIAHAKDLMGFLLESKGFISPDIEDWIGCDRETARDIVSSLRRCYAIRRGRKSYIKTEPFIEHLKELLPKSENLTPEFLAKKEEF